MQQANGGNNCRSRNVVQSTKQATAWINCAEGAEAKFWPQSFKRWGGVAPPPPPPTHKHTPHPLGVLSC